MACPCHAILQACKERLHGICRGETAQWQTGMLGHLEAASLCWQESGILGWGHGRGVCPNRKEIPKIDTAMRLYNQQETMYKNMTYRAEHRIVSLSQTWLRPIVRGKVNVPVEFGEKQKN